MPETPELQNETAVAVVDIPMNDGEKERFGAALNLEDRRRRESMLNDQLKGMAGTSAGEIQSRFARSPSARKRQKAMIRKTQELKNLTRQYGDVWEGPCAPATIINLNPIPLQLYGQLQSYRMAAAGKGNLVNLLFRGRTFVASYMTIRTPEVWLAHTGIELDPIADTPQMEPRYVSPVGLAYQFYSHYSIGASDAQGIGGILIFEGDIHVLSAAHLERNQRMVRVPFAEPSPDLHGEVIYSSVERSLEEYLGAELDRQRIYAEAIIAEGHSYGTSSDSEERKKLTNLHKIWHNYALDYGYIRKAHSWASQQLDRGPLKEVVSCPDCGTEQQNDEYFCRNCAAPFDAHKAFMAGKPVASAYLAVYEEDSAEFKDILRELERRRRRMALLGVSDEPQTQTRKGRQSKEKQD